MPPLDHKPARNEVFKVHRPGSLAKESLYFLVLLGVFVKLFMAGIILAPNQGWAGHTFVDIWGWSDFIGKVNQGFIPFVDFSKEYPTGAGAIFWLMAKLIPDPNSSDSILRFHITFMSLFDILNTCLIYIILEKIAPKRALWLSILFLLLPTGLLLSPMRFESVVMTPVLLGYYFRLKENHRMSVVFWSIGAMLKWYPLLFIMAQSLAGFTAINKQAGGSKREWAVQALKDFMIFAAVALITNVPFILGDLIRHRNIENWWATYAFHLNRPLYWDTLFGVYTLWVREIPVERWAPYWTLVLVTGAMLIGRKIDFDTQCVLICLACIVFNRIYSTQFHMWFYPFIIFLLARMPVRQALSVFTLFMVLELVNIGVYPFTFAGTLTEITTFAPRRALQFGGIYTKMFSILIIVRTWLVIQLAVFLTKDLNPLLSTLKRRS